MEGGGEGSQATGWLLATVKLGQSSASPKLTTVGLKTGLAGGWWLSCSASVTSKLLVDLQPAIGAASLPPTTTTPGMNH